MTRAYLGEEMHDLKKADITMSNQPNPLDNAVCAFGNEDDLNNPTSIAMS